MEHGLDHFFSTTESIIRWMLIAAGAGLLAVQGTVIGVGLHHARRTGRKMTKLVRYLLVSYACAVAVFLCGTMLPSRGPMPATFAGSMALCSASSCLFVLFMRRQPERGEGTSDDAG